MRDQSPSLASTASSGGPSLPTVATRRYALPPSFPPSLLHSSDNISLHSLTLPPSLPPSLQVSYHTRNPQLNDEVKLRLPDVLTPAHHLVFSVYHVHVKKQSSILSSLKQAVGGGSSSTNDDAEKKSSATLIGKEKGKEGGREGRFHVIVLNETHLPFPPSLPPSLASGLGSLPLLYHTDTPSSPLLGDNKGPGCLLPDALYTVNIRPVKQQKAGKEGGKEGGREGGLSPTNASISSAVLEEEEGGYYDFDDGR